MDHTLEVQARYADQPHLTRACARLTGLPAAALVASGAGPVGRAPHPSLTPPSSVTVQCGLWATSHGWPSGSMNTEL